MALDVRIRDITHTLDGDILLLTDGENAKIVQLLPAK
jgi:glucose/arabinose dehydrogenase